ncbi:MAG: hypothetical protein JXC85_00325 [Candidatus Aenigmarchaeota archaeon]|nr:hypothetical protein [Candidatus Aenigmarchaeota archaeon]
MHRFLNLSVAFILTSIILAASGQAFQVFMDKHVYEINESMAFKVNRTQNVNITGMIVNSTGDNPQNFTIVNGTPGIVEYEFIPSPPLIADEYEVTVTENSSSVQLGFGVVDEVLFPVVRIMGATEPYFVDTSTEVNDETGGIGGNFSELLEFNLSDTIMYGEYPNLTGDGRNYSFAVVDSKAEGVYDVVYVDDDGVFQLFNDAEDDANSPFIEAEKKPGDMLEIDSNNKFIMADIEHGTGKEIYMIVPLDSPVFASTDTLHMIILVMDKNGEFKPDQMVNISVLTEAKSLVEYRPVSVGAEGYANISVSLSGYSSGKYFILVNGTPADVFKVESFSLHGKVTDLSNNPNSYFSPGSKAKIWAISRSATGDLMALDSPPTGKLYLPNGSTRSLSFSSQSTGVYAAETSTLTVKGGYGVEIVGKKGSDTEKFMIGFDVKSIEMMVMTVNPKYMDEGPGEATMISTFAPGSNVTAVVFMINMSKGSGMKSGGPPCGLDGSSCIDITCDASQFDILARDKNGKIHKLDGSNFSVMKVSDASTLLGLPPPDEPGMSDQCLIMVWGQNNTWLSNTGSYKLRVQFTNASLGTFVSGEYFDVQRLLAKGSTVDFKGDKFSFFAPNSTVRVKIEIRDMVTDQLLSASSIINAKFTEMWKEWPERKNAFKDMSFSKAILNETMDGDKIVFTSPPEEGFYTAKFRFIANVGGQPIEGTGIIFFELKKYMVWANLESIGEDNWFVKSGENITLSVTIMDIDMGSQFGKGSTPSCTGCTGLVATIGGLRNEQFFKDMTEGSDYDVVEGVVINSTSGASLTIEALNLPTGWYGVDIELYRPGSNESYYGWGGFEIRNFWVDIMELEEDGGNYSKAEGGNGRRGITLPAGGHALLGVVAYSPPSKFSPPMPMKVTSINVEGFMNDMFWPPIPVPGGKYGYSVLGQQNITDCRDDQCEEYPVYMINFSLAGDIDESEYMLTIDATAGGAGSDVGTAWITVSSYVVEYETIPEDKMYEFPPVYSASENLRLLFTAGDFDKGPHNITNVTVMEIFSEKLGRPIKFKMYDNYTNNCTGSDSSCLIDVNLSGLSTGEYFIDMEIVDDADKRQLVGFEFEIKNLLFSVPQIYEGWTMDYSTPDKYVSAWFGEDTCSNERGLWGDNDPQWNGTNNISAVFDDIPFNITIPYIKNVSFGPGPHGYFWSTMCIEKQSGTWRQISSPPECPSGKYIFLVANGTYAWINTSSDMSNTDTLTNGSTFELSNYPNLTWEVNALSEDEPYMITIKLAGYVCGRNEMEENGTFIMVVPPSDAENHSTFYHGPNYIVGDMWQQGPPDENSPRFRLNISDRPVYVYHNTTHLWIFPGLEDVNFTSAGVQGPVAPGGAIEDGYGGRWKVISISKGQITLKGENILENGIMVNTSLSKSGRIMLGHLEEDRLGFEDKFKEEKKGLDLDGDGNSTGGYLYFLLLDDGTGYNKLIYSNYSQAWNFTDESMLVDLNDPDRNNRQVGLNDQLTLLNIDPRASMVLFYDPDALGDWPELGDFKIFDNITIPVIVKSPDGSPVVANVSVPHVKVKTQAGTSIMLTGFSPVVLSGIGEISVNVSALGLGSGRFEFELKASNDTIGEEMMNEWMWPRATVRNFLVDNHAGYGGITTSLVGIDVQSFGSWGSDVHVRELFTYNESDQGHQPLPGLMSMIRHELSYPASCTEYEEPGDAGIDDDNKTFILDRFDGQYYAFMTHVNESIWLAQGNCNFSQSTALSAGVPVNITLGSELFMLRVLNASIDHGALGLANFASINASHIRMDSDGPNDAPRWMIMSINLSHTEYNVVFANDSMPYPQAGTWGTKEVAKSIWIDTDGNFSDATKLVIGDSIPGTDYHLARVGPEAWAGIIVANTSGLSALGISAKPGMDLRVQDGTTTYFGLINESDQGLGLDLNMDDDMLDVFYMVAFDEFEDGQQNVTRIYIDDDLNITEPWWANSSHVQDDGFYLYYDFYGAEGESMQEREGNPPMGMWGGHLEFAPRNDSLSWEESPQWNIKYMDGGKMIIEKDVCHLDKNKTISLTVKAFDFTQTPMPGANVTLQKLMRFGGGEQFKELNGSSNDFTLIETQNVTDSKGYAMLKLVPPAGGWLNNAEYIAVLEVEHSGVKETVDNWFRIGKEDKFK